MKIIDYEILSKKIERRRKEANKEIIKNRVGRVLRKRVRSEDEKTILDHISKSRWEKAIKCEKIKVISEREVYYDFD